ncbi:MAG: ribosomal protein S12 methylthiotransferase accessory factor [Natronomonas sp.]|jgi:ribosomal protein S12 methylthiotransferase accessory factor
MTVGLVGSGPAVAAVEAALADVDADPRAVDPVDLGDVAAGAVVGDTGSDAFTRANEAALDGETPWLAVEVGGVGGARVVDAAVTALSPATACYECLCGRVKATLEGESGPVATGAGTPASAARLAGATAGYALARYLSKGADIFGQVTEVGAPPVQRELLALPGCACDAGPSVGTDLDRSPVDRDVDGALARAERGVDKRVGLLREVGEVESFPVPYYLAQTCETGGFSDASAQRQSAGVDAGWDGAFMKALGEGMERYCAGVYRRSALPRGLPAEVASPVPPAAFVCRDESAVTAPLYWVEGEHLVTGESAHLPAAFVVHPPPTERFRPPLTTGLGLGNGGVGALLAGLYEVVERDATMLSWYSTADPLALAVEDEVVETLTDRARSEGLDVTLLLVTQDIDIPVVAAAVHREAWPRFALGSGANLDAATAARSALAEALQNWTELRSMGPEDAQGESGAVARYADLPPAAAEFIDADATVSADSVSSSELSGETELAAALDRLGDAGLDAYAARLTTRDVAALGFEAVRVVVPPAQPLFLGDAYFGERAESVPASLGFEARLGREHHPFP